MAIGWNSRAEALLDTDGPAPEVAARTRLAAAPTIDDGTIPAASLWWNGFVIARHASDEDADASFRIMLEAISPALLEDHADASAWLVAGYVPTPASAGLMDTVDAGAVPYPMLAPMGLLHTAIGDNLAEFLQGRESAEQALSDAAVAYRATARERGLIG